MRSVWVASLDDGIGNGIAEIGMLETANAIVIYQ